MLRVLIIGFVLALLTIAVVAIVRISNAPAPRDYGPDFAALIESLQPPLAAGESPGTNGWGVAVELGRRLQQLIDEPREEDTEQLFAFYRLIAPEASDTPAQVALVQTGLDRVEVSGLFADTKRLLNVRRASSWQAYKGVALEDGRHIDRSSFRVLGWALAAQAQREFARGNTDSALDRLEESAALAAILRLQPTIMDNLTANAVVAATMLPLGRAVESGSLDVASLVRTARILESMAASEPLSAAIEGERLMSLAALNRSSRLKRARLISETNRYYDSVMRLVEATPSVRQTDPDLLLIKQELDRLSNELRRFGGAPAEPAPWAGYLVNLDRFITDVHAMRITVALARHQARTGTLPASLEELTPVDMDHLHMQPREGFSLIYHRTGNGFALYNTGPDGFDDGGRRHPDDPNMVYSAKGVGYDFVYR